ncbi:coiled-coil domain-containing protein 55-domain containing protein [Bisporella sp. PMI_857]|nr:coiled-coil domain-containing protein 55-domain containing protein [Bisporella sp. PMI_857]
MSGKGLAYGLNVPKKAGASKPQSAKRKTIFEEEDSDGENANNGDGSFEAIGEFGGISTKKMPPKPIRKPAESAIKPQLGAGSKKMPISMYGDLSTNFSSKKHAEKAEELDENIYDYDGVYDSLKPHKKTTVEDEEKRPKYMKNLIEAAAVRKRDATIAEEKKLARDREAEGDEFADKEKFVTSAYKKQQEENRRIEEEERRREEEEAKKNKGAGMSGFYKKMLEKDDKKHAEVLKAAEEREKNGLVEQVEEEETKMTDADLAREINKKKAGAIEINDEGQVVDKRQLLKGGLNILAKPKKPTTSNAQRGASSASDRSGTGFVGAAGGKQAMRERQTHMMEAQLEAATKRAREEEEEERLKLENAAKSQKTQGDIMSAKERYLARKREAEEAKKRGEQQI